MSNGPINLMEFGFFFVYFAFVKGGGGGERKGWFGFFFPHYVLVFIYL